MTLRQSLPLTLLFAIALPCVAQADADIEKGKAIYNGLGGCVACHGAMGKGDGAAAAALTPKPNDFSKGVFKYDANGDGKTGTEDDIAAVIGNGAAKFGGSPMMVGRADIPEADRKALAKYVLSLKE